MNLESGCSQPVRTELLAQLRLRRCFEIRTSAVDLGDARLPEATRTRLAVGYEVKTEGERGLVPIDPATWATLGPRRQAWLDDAQKIL